MGKTSDPVFIIQSKPMRYPRVTRGILKRKRPMGSASMSTRELVTAISSASQHQLVSLVCDACAQLEQVRELVVQQLLQPAPDARRVFETCWNCGDEYVLERNRTPDCVHHPGVREVDEESSVWEDHDPDVFGDAWTLPGHESFEDGFLWSCCDAHVNAIGCTFSQHEPIPPKYMRMLRRRILAHE